MLERAHCVNPVHCGNVLVTHLAVTEKHLTKSNKSNKSYFYLKLFFKLTSTDFNKNLPHQGALFYK